MKNTIFSITKGLLYYALFLLIQIVITSVYLREAILNFAREQGGLHVLQDSLLREDFLLSFEASGSYNIIALISGIIFVTVVCLFFLIRKKNIFDELSLKKFSLNAVLPVILFGVSLNFTIRHIFFDFLKLPGTSYADYRIMYGSFVLNFFATVLVTGIAEEICFRSLVYKRFKKGMPVFWAILLSTILFGLAHHSNILVLNAAVFSIPAIYLFEKFDSVIPCMIQHMSFNFVAVFMSFIWLHFDIPNNQMLYLDIFMLIVCVLSLIYIIKMPVKKQ